MLRSVTKKLEIELFWGGAGYGKPLAASSTGTTLTIQTAEWAPGIWAGAEGMPIEWRNAAGVSLGTYTVLSVDMVLRTLTLDGTVPSAKADTDVIWHKGAYGNEFLGVYAILTTSGVLFNINNSTYTLFKGNTYDAASGALSFTKLSLAAARAVEKGLDTKLTCYINPRTWSNLMSDQAALRKYDSSYSSSMAENGSQAIKFWSQNGEMEIEPSIYVKEGTAFLLDIEDWYRVGSTDVTFKRPGQGEEFFRDLENSAAYELRLYTDQALFTMTPGRNVVITGIVNQQ